MYVAPRLAAPFTRLTSTQISVGEETFESVSKVQTVDLLTVSLCRTRVGYHAANCGREVLDVSDYPKGRRERDPA